jgi:hypothetical protein
VTGTGDDVDPLLVVADPAVRVEAAAVVLVWLAARPGSFPDAICS